jgi:hypothetical protein
MEKKKRGCTNCKKKVQIMPEVEPEQLQLTEKEIRTAYDNLTSYRGVNPEHFESINHVFKTLFDEDFKFNCGGCGSYQAKRLHNYVTFKLNNNG